MLTITEKKRFQTIDGETLMNRPPMEQPFVVDTLIGPGLHLLAGSPKVGKSWLVLWLAVSIAKGEAVWGREVKQGETLYLCLEDNEARIQNRLFYITDYAPPNCHFAVSACTLGKGLEEQIKTFMAEHPGTVLIIVDTLQLIRNTAWDSTYASDYKDLTRLKEMADGYGIAILLVHHLRKEEAPDKFNQISGTTAMQGAVDSSFVLIKEKRGNGLATLHCVGRDIENRKMELQKNKENIWELVSDSLDTPDMLQDKTVQLIRLLLKEEKELKLTPTELSDKLNALLQPGDDTYTNRIVSRRLMECEAELSSLRISFKIYPSNGKRMIQIWGPGDDDDDKTEPGATPPNIGSIVAAGTLAEEADDTPPV